jgi:hypothetical protein
MSRRTTTFAFAIGAILAFLVIGLHLVWDVIPTTLLTGDEVFYYFQAVHLRQGRLVWFSDTNPYLYPLVLAVSGLGDPAALRTIGVVLVALAGGLLFWLTLTISEGQTEGALWAMSLFLFYHETLHVSTELFTEAVFAPAFAAFALAFVHWTRGRPEVCRMVLLGLLAGLLLGARVVGGVLVAASLLFWIGENGWRDFNRLSRAIAIVIGAAALMHLPFLLATHSMDSLLSSLFDPRNPVKRAGLFAQPIGAFLARFLPGTEDNHWICLLAALAAWPIRRYRGVRLLTAIGGVYLLAELFLDFYFAPRHLYPLVIMACVLIGCALEPLSRKIPRWALRAMLGLLVLANASRGIAREPTIYGNNYYFVGGSMDAIELRDFTSSDESRKAAAVTLPYFGQPYYSRYVYRAAFRCARDFEYLLINFISDRLRVTIDGRLLTPAFVADPFDALAVRWPIPAGDHRLEIEVDGDVLLNGLGQVLVVDEDFLWQRVIRYHDLKVLDVPAGLTERRLVAGH